MSAAEVNQPNTLRVKVQRITAELSASVDCFNVSKKRSQNCLIKFSVTLCKLSGNQFFAAYD